MGIVKKSVRKMENFDKENVQSIPLNASPSKRRLQELMLTPKITEEPKELYIELKSKLPEISLNSWARSNSSSHYSGPTSLYSSPSSCSPRSDTSLTSHKSIWKTSSSDIGNYPVSPLVLKDKVRAKQSGFTRERYHHGMPRNTRPNI